LDGGWKRRGEMYGYELFEDGCKVFVGAIVEAGKRCVRLRDAP